MTDTKRRIINQTKLNLSRRLGAEICSASEAAEVLDALAYACTFTAPRTLGGILMTPQRWQELADTLTLSELMNVTNALPRFHGSGNRLFYILGCFARCYGLRSFSSGKSDSDSDHKQRQYTNAEMERIMKELNKLDINDLL